MHYTLYVSDASQNTNMEHQIHYLTELLVYENYKEQIHPMHYTSPAHPQEKKQEYHIDYPQRLVIHNDVSNVFKFQFVKR